MNQTRALISTLGLVMAGALFFARDGKNPGPQVTSAKSAQVKRAQKLKFAGTSGQRQLIESYGKLPLSFEANQGQTDTQVRFLSRGRGYALFLTGNEAVLSLGGQKRSGPATYLRETRIAERSRQFAGLSALLEKPPALRAEAELGKETRAGDVVHLKLVGANTNPKAVGTDELPGTSNYFIGNDPKKWRTNVPNYAKVRYKDVYPSVDLVYYGNQGQLEYDFIVAPGADPNGISLAVAAMPALSGAEGTPPLQIDADGDLVIKADSGEVRLHKPVVYQEESGFISHESGRKPLATENAGRTTDDLTSHPSPVTRHFLEARYVLTTDDRIRFEISSYDKTRPLVIDPVLAYSTYLGGSSSDFVSAIAVDSSDSAYVTGQTPSTDFPTMHPIQAANTGVYDVFVSKLNAAGSALVYSTYLGGSSSDAGFGIAVDPSGNAYVVGNTCSSDFPATAGAFQNAFQGPACSGGAGGDAFVAKINAAGDGLAYSTYLGGSGRDAGVGVAVDSLGNAYVTGNTTSADFPTVNSIQAYGGAGNAFVTKLNAAGSELVYSTFLGGSGGDDGGGIAVDPSGNAYVVGSTSSTDFPTVHPIQAANAGGSDAFVAKLNAAGSALVYSTYLGGSGSDAGSGIAVDSSGSAYVIGSTSSFDFPTMNPFQAKNAGDSPSCQPGQCGSDDAFVAKMNAAGSALVYCTYLGGYRDDFGSAIAVDSLGNAYVTGSTGSGFATGVLTNFPILNPVQASYGGDPGDAFVSKLSATGGALAYSTYLGGGGSDGGMAIAVDSSGSAYVTGQSGSSDFPTMNPIRAANAGGLDAFIAKISPPVALSPQSLAFSGQMIGTTSNAQSVSLTNISGATLNISSFSVTGDFALASTGTTCSTSSPVLAGSSCKINVTFTPAASGSRTGKLTVIDSDPTSPQIAALAGTGEDFEVEVASGSSSSATVSAGGTATYTISVSPLGGFNVPVSLSCKGAPSLSSCTPSVSSVMLDGTDAQNVTFTVTTTASTLTAQHVRSFPIFAFSLFLTPLLAFTLVGARRRTVSKPVFLILAPLLGSLIYLAACGSENHPPMRKPGTPPGTYTLTISGASGSLSHSTQVTLKVE